MKHPLLRFSLICSITTLAMFATAIAQSPVAQTEPNDSIANATPTGLTAGQPGGIVSIGNSGDGPFGPTEGDGTGDFDFFSVDTAQGQTIVLDVDGSSIGKQLDTVAGIFNSSGALVASNDDDGATTDSSISYTTPSAGTYYAVVGSFVEGNAEANLPSDPAVGGTGIGAPGGGIDDYEVVVGLDIPVFLVASPLDFPLIGRDENTEGTLTLTNEGTDDATVTSLSIKGQDATSFGIDLAVPFTIRAGAAKDLAVSFDPQGSNDNRTAVLEIVSDDTARPNRELPLSGKAIDGLVLRLGFDDPEDAPLGSFAAPLDQSGNGFQAAYVENQSEPILGRPSLVGGDGASVGFEDGGGTANYVLTANGFPSTPTVSYSLWIQPMEGAGNDALFNRDPAFSQSDTILGLTLLSDGSLRFRIDRSEIILTDPELIEDEQIYHIVVTHLDTDGADTGEADRTRLYVNGELIGEETDTFEIPLYPDSPANSRLWIATHSAAGSGYTGDMDDFQVYNIELTPEEVLNMFQNPGTTASSPPPAPIEITSVAFAQETRTVSLTWNSRPGKTYLLESSPDLTEPWVEIADAIDSGGETTSATDAAIAADIAVKYYRVSEE